jgi:GT2 family glycosyltransferase
LDHDDVLDESALFRVAEYINLFPDAGILYSDEDKITDDGTRKDPYFKSDWNPDLFLSHNMVSHLGVYRRELVSQVGGFREGYEGSQDHDLALRVSELLQPDQIVHIPYVLYHWRVIPGSTALAGSEKNYAIKAAVRAINDALIRREVSARATESELVPGSVRVRYALPEPTPKVNLIIPTRNGLNLLRTCISSIIEKTHYPEYEIIVIDNGSDDPATLEYLTTLTEHCAPVPVRVIRDDRPFNYSQLNNMAVNQANGDVIGLINNDIEVINGGWLEEMVSHACRPEIGAVGARLLYSDGRLQHAGVVIGIGGIAGHFMKYLPPEGIDYFSKTRLIQNYSAVTAACLVMRKSVYLDMGGLDEINLSVAFNDVDLCLRLCQAGYRIVYTPFAELYHHESATRGPEYETSEKAMRAEREIEYMKARWDIENLRDPAYSPNLSIYHEDCSYSFPPRL